MSFKDKLKSLKIEPVKVEHRDFARNKTIGFRGVRENLGVTTLVAHIGVELAAQGFTVCIVDLDFKNPSCFFAKQRNYTILDKINNASKNVMTILNKTEYKNLSYIGALPQEPVTTYLPLVEDEKFIDERKHLIQRMFEDLEMQFEVVLIDIPSDIRIPESVIGMLNSKMLLTVCSYDYPCTSSLTKDCMMLTDVIPDDRLYDVVNMSTPFIVGGSYENIEQKIKVISDIKMSKMVFDDSYNLVVDRNRIGNNVTTGARDMAEHYYYTGIQNIIIYMKEGKIVGNKIAVQADEPESIDDDELRL